MALRKDDLTKTLELSQLFDTILMALYHLCSIFIKAKVVYSQL